LHRFYKKAPAPGAVSLIPGREVTATASITQTLSTMHIRYPREGDIQPE